MSGEDAGAVRRTSELARSAAEERTRWGTQVRYLRSVFIPEDETCLLLYEAPSAEAVREAARGAGLQFERVLEAVEG